MYKTRWIVYPVLFYRLSAVMEQQHLFKCQGTFVGHKVRVTAVESLENHNSPTHSLTLALIQGPIWALAKSHDLLFSASADCTIKVHMCVYICIWYICGVAFQY